MLPIAQFDHKAFLLNTRRELLVKRMRRRVFRFEAKWIRDEEGRHVVEEGWGRRVAGQSHFKIAQGKLFSSQGDLIRWSLRRDKDFETAMKQKTERLKIE